MTNRVVSAALAVALVGGGCAALASSAATAGPAPSTEARMSHPHGPAFVPLNILIANDDGWRGPGGSSTPLIVDLRDALVAEGHHVVVVAPGTDQSGQGGRISLPPTQLDVATPESGVWTVTPGSPADSVYFALDQVFAGRLPDLVITGMNPGANTGQAIKHSGTVNAALTALEEGVPSIAVSIDTPATWREGAIAAGPASAAYVADLVERLEKNARRGVLIPPGVSLNVNLPVRPGPIDPATGKPGSVLPPLGERITTLATSPFINFDYQNTTGAPGAAGRYNIIPGAPTGTAGRKTDVQVVQRGYISFTPLESDSDTDVATWTWLRRLIR